MLQLDNTHKGEYMLTPEQIAVQDEQIKQLPTIIGLHQKNEEIIQDLEGLRVGQESLSRTVSEGFAKGKDRMDGIEGKVESLREMMLAFIAQSQSNHNELKNEIKDGKIQELRNDLHTKAKEDEKRAAFKSGLTIGLTVLAVGSGLSFVGFLVSKVLWP